MNQFFQKPWVRWLLVLLGIVGLGWITTEVLLARELHGVAIVCQIVFSVLFYGWCYFGLFKKRSHAWAKWGAFYLTATIALMNIGVVLSAMGYQQNALRVFCFWLISGMTVGGIHLARLALSFSHPVAAVARTVIDQANRMHLVKLTALVVVIIVVFLPLYPDPAERLDYRIQFYLTWSLNISTMFLGLLTVLLGCWTVSSDFSNRQIFMLASKPVGRFSYIAGKAIGLMLLNAVLLFVVMLGVWFGAQVMYAEPVQNARQESYKDNARRDLFTARRMARPQFADDVDQAGMITRHFERLKSESPNAGALAEKPQDMSTNTLMQINGRIVDEWHTIKPLDTQRYVFHGLKEIVNRYRPFVQEVRRRRAVIAKLFEEKRVEEGRAEVEKLNAMQFPQTSLRLRLKPKHTMNAPDDRVRIIINVGGAGAVALEPIANDTVRELSLDRYIGLIDDEGRLELRIKHMNAWDPENTFKGAIKFKPEEGLAMYYTAGSFEGNLVRAAALFWVRLAFLSMASIAAAIFVSFPVAVLISLVVYGAASISQFASDSLDRYVALQLESPSKWDTIVGIGSGIFSNLGDGEFGEVFKLFLSLIGKTVLLIVPSFGAYSPTERISDGLFVPYELVGNAYLFVGLICTGLCMNFAWLVFRRKELARVTV